MCIFLEMRMKPMQKMFNDLWETRTEVGPFYDVFITIANNRSDAVEVLENILKQERIAYDLSADIYLKRLQPHHEKPKTYIRQYNLTVRDMPENVLWLMYEANEHAKNTRGKALFKTLIEETVEEESPNSVFLNSSVMDSLFNTSETPSPPGSQS